MAYNIGIRKCRKCDNNIRCEECVFPRLANGRAEEIAELYKTCKTAEQTIKAQTELIKQQKAEIAELKKHPHCPPCVDFCLYSENYEKHDKAVRTEAIRELAARTIGFLHPWFDYDKGQIEGIINSCIKEMVRGDTE